MRVLVTGANGMIGRSVFAKFVHSKLTQTIIGLRSDYCDLTNAISVHQWLSQQQFDVIFHLAGNPNTRPGVGNVYADNVIATRNLLDACERMDMPYFVFASSASIYGDYDHPPNFATPPNPKSVYAASKLHAEQLVLEAGIQGYVRPKILRLVANVGPYSRHGLVHDIVKKLQSDSPTLRLLGDAPGSMKPFCWVGDTATAMVDCLDWELTGVNVSPDGLLTVEEVAHVVMSVTGIRKPIEWLGESANWPGDNRLVQVDNSQIKSLMQFECSTSIEAVIKVAKECISTLS